MNGEIPSVPITTLAGISSLTDLLGELPLPTPVASTVNNKSLLFHPKIADDARQLLATANNSLVTQLTRALKKTSTDHIELKDNLAGESIEGDVPELLKAILAYEPNVFKSGRGFRNSDGTGGVNSTGGTQHFNQQPSPYQAGQISPCPPGSPARFPPQPGSSPSRYSGQTSLYGPVGVSGAASQYQMQFLNFSSPEKPDGPTVNGGLSNSPGHQNGTTPPHPRGRSNSRHKSATVSSPAQAAAAPATVDMSSTQRGHYEEAGRRRSSKASEPVVLLEPLRSEEFSHIQPAKRSLSLSAESSGSRGTSKNEGKATPTLQPTIKLLRFDSTLSETDLVHREDARYHVHSSDDVDQLTIRVGKNRTKEEPKRGRKRVIESDDETYFDEWSESVVIKKKKRKKKMNDSMNMSAEELMETPTFRKFGAILESVLESSEDIDLGALVADDDDVDGTSEAIITKSTLSDLCNESAKLKSMAVMNQIPYEKLVRLLAILHWNIKDGCRAFPSLAEQDDHDDESITRELAFERVVTAVDAGLAALNIMTAPNMPKQVYVEDVIERIVTLTKAQMQNTIFPEFDPVYRVDPKGKTGYSGNTKMKRARSHGAKHKTTITLYNKLSEMVGCLAELVSIQELTDTIILQTSTLAVSPFFVENISELQLNALKLVTSVFSRYEKHRQLILEDILSSLARLPSSKKNLRNYRLNSDEHIQMVTALALELIQCVVRLPSHVDDKEQESEGNSRDVKEVDDEVVIVTSYETAMRTAHNFLAVFLKKCATKGEEDYRPLFENFVYDLLATVNKPEWPAAELLLSLLGRLLVQQFSNKSVDMSLRVASLDYLGIVAARLRKDAVTSKLNEDVFDEIIAHINDNSDEESGSDSEGKKSKRKKQKGDVLEKTCQLQKALLQYLLHNSQNDPSLVFAWQFYIAQWYRDCGAEVEKEVKGNSPKKSPKNTPSKAIPRRRSSRRGRSREESSEEEESSEDDDEDVHKEGKDLEKMQQIQQLAEKRKAFLLGQIVVKVEVFASFKPSPSKLDYDNAILMTRYLASNRPFSQSFDIYLTQILKVLCETAVAVRTKAMKCLTAVIEADPGILARGDMQRGVHGRFMDQSTAVREAAVELVGKFILIRPELTTQYYDMLSDRILDTGISVRKRVIKIFRDICMDQPDFPKISEMCVRMIRRVNDEEGIKKLVNETFQAMWFTPLRDKHLDQMLQRVMNITDVVAACKDTGYDWFEQLLENLLKKEETAASKPVEKACLQIIDCLVDNVLTLEERTAEGADGKISTTGRLVASLSTLHLFCKVKPELLTNHCTTIQPYLNIKCSTQVDFLVLHNVARILEVSVPLMEHPSESFLAQLEEDMMKLVLRHGMMVLQSCVSCLGSVVNNVTHNYKLVRDCFQKFFGVLSKLMAEHKRDPLSPHLANSRPTLLRSLFTVGLLCKHFDFDSVNFGEKRDAPEPSSDFGSVKVSIKDRVFDVILYFINHEDEEVEHKALTGLGFLCTRHYEFMLGKQLRDLYHRLLTHEGDDGRGKTRILMQVQVLKNLSNYLTEEEVKMIKSDAEWRKHRDKEDLKEMGDIQSGMASTVIQVYLKPTLESFFSSSAQVRMATLSVIVLVLRQGLVHPVQCVPYLICMGTDCDSQVRVKADQQLQEIDKKYPGFIQMKAMQGIKFSYRMQTLIQSDVEEPVRGIRFEENNSVALNNYIYSLIRSSRNYRRALLSSTLNLFDDTAKTPLTELVYMADNLASFPYQMQDEPLYIIHQVDILVSVSGSNLLQSFQEQFYAGSTEDGKPKRLDDDEDEDVDLLLSRMPEDVSQLQELYTTAQGCVLLLVLKQHLKELYGFTDNKISRYSPQEQAKVFDKPLNRRHNVKFNPTQVLDIIKKGVPPSELDDEGKKTLVEKYLDFKDLMLSIDPDDPEDEDDLPPPKPQPSGEPGTSSSGGEGVAVDGADGNTSVQDGEKSEAANSNAEANKSSTNTTSIDLTGDGDSVNQPQQRTPISSHRHHHHHRPHSHHRGSDRKRGRPSSSSSSKSRSQHQSHHHKSHKHKKKKKKRKCSDSESGGDSDDDSDPDFVV